MGGGSLGPGDVGLPVPRACGRDLGHWPSGARLARRGPYSSFGRVVNPLAARIREAAAAPVRGRKSGGSRPAAYASIGCCGRVVRCAQGPGQSFAMARKLIDDCFAPTSKRLRHAEALAILKEDRRRSSHRSGSAWPRRLAASWRRRPWRRVPVPAHTNAAVDGYSFAAADYDRAAGERAAVEGRAAAGHALAQAAGQGAAVRIFTGAVVPEGHDTVVMQEDVRFGTVGWPRPAWPFRPD